MMRLEARDIAVRRGEDLLIDGLSFDLEAGQALVVTGRNGSGKSTLLRAIAGLIPMERGAIRLEGPGPSVHRVAEAGHYLGHRNAMKREMSVYENLAFWKAFMGGSGASGTGPGLDPDEAAERLGLSGIIHLPFGYLSAGQQRRMAFAKLLVAHRHVWLLDEPTSALDSQSERVFAGLVGEHLAQGGMVLAATHQPLGLAEPRTIVMTGFRHAEMI